MKLVSNTWAADNCTFTIRLLHPNCKILAMRSRSSSRYHLCMYLVIFNTIRIQLEIIFFGVFLQSSLSILPAWYIIPKGGTPLVSLIYDPVKQNGKVGTAWAHWQRSGTVGRWRYFTLFNILPTSTLAVKKHRRHICMEKRQCLSWSQGKNRKGSASGEFVLTVRVMGERFREIPSVQLILHYFIWPKYVLCVHILYPVHLAA